MHDNLFSKRRHVLSPPSPSFSSFFFLLIVLVFLWSLFFFNRRQELDLPLSSCTSHYSQFNKSMPAQYFLSSFFTSHSSALRVRTLFFELEHLDIYVYVDAGAGTNFGRTNILFSKIKQQNGSLLSNYKNKHFLLLSIYVQILKKKCTHDRYSLQEV